MDDQGKRLLLALVISFAFLFFYQSYFLPTATVPVEEQSGQEAPAQPAETARNEAIAPAPETLPAAAEPMEPITADQIRTLSVSTPLYTARLTNRGGALSSFKLLKYRLQKDDPDSNVEMVRAVDEEQILPLAAEFTAAGGPLGFSGALFRMEGSDMDLEDGEEGSVVFRYRTAEGLEMVKTITFLADTYEVLCSVKLTNRSGQALRGRATVLWAPGLEPPEGAEKGSMFSASRYGYQGALFQEGQGRPERIKGAKLEGQRTMEGPFTWIATEDMYFVAALLPESPADGAIARKGSGNRVQVGVYTQVELPPGSVAPLETSVYVGPKEMASLRRVAPSLVSTIELGIFGFIAKPLLQLLHFFYGFVGNYGLAIIILSALIKIVFIPFSTISHRSMKKMSRLQPQINALRDRYKKDREKLNQEIMKLYQENKVNPASGCLPILVQIPVFFALYRALLGAIELRHAPFYFWITDLSAKDPLYITPIIMGATMVLQQRMTPTTGDPRQAQIMMFMPVVFTALFLSFPSGLVIYWTVNNVLTIGHQYWMNKQMKKEESAAVADEETKKGKGKKKK